MDYKFDATVNRRHTNSTKWDVGENELPMWVADMDFKTAPAVINALNKKVQTGVFGYTNIPEEWKDAIQNWWKRRHDIVFEKDWIIFCTGVVPAITTAVKRLTNVGDNVVVQTPAYNIFFNSIVNHGRHALENPLAYDGECYQMDFADLEEKLAHPLTTMMILCNPQNPTGNIWTPEDLKKVGELCQKHHVVVVSDEIHCDITDKGYNYTPFASASQVCATNSVTCISASKAFNLAGLQSAAVVIPDEALRNKMERGLNSGEVAEPNVFATEAVIAAFNDGEKWLDELREYIFMNKRIVKAFIEKELPQVKIIEAKATYLIWLDFGNAYEDVSGLCSFIREKTGLYLSHGSQYRGNGSQFIRMNVACPSSRVQDGLKRLKRALEMYQEDQS